LALYGTISEVTSAQWYAIADEATDISGTEQVSVSVCWVVDNCYEVHEDFLGLKELPDTKAMTIHHEVKEFVHFLFLDVEGKLTMELAT